MDPNRKGSREELRGIEGGETLIRIYYARKRLYFSIKGKKNPFL